MPSETDPLLPRGNTAPEISGYGFSRSSESQYQIQHEVLDYPKDIEDKSEQQARPSYGDISPLRTILALFIIVVGLAMFVSLLIPGAWNPPWNKAPEDAALTTKARVDKILAETPLIEYVSFRVRISSLDRILRLEAFARSEHPRNMFQGSVYLLK